MAKNKPLKKWTSEELKAGYYRNRPQDDPEGGLPSESDSLKAIRNEKFGRLSKDTQDKINKDTNRFGFRAGLYTQAAHMRGDEKATIGRTFGRMTANRDSTMFEKPDGYAYGGRVNGKEDKPMKKMAEAKMERSKKDMASDKKMVKGEKGYAMGGFVGRVLGGPLGQKLAGMRGGMAGNLMYRMRGRLNRPATAPTPAAPAAPQPANAWAKKAIPQAAAPAPAPASVQRAIPQAAQAAAPAPAPAPTTTPRPGYAYGGKVSDPKSGVRESEMSSKKQGMDPKSAARMEEMKWVKGVQKKAGYAFGGMVKGGKGKKGC